MFAISLGNSKLGRAAISHLLARGVDASQIVAVARTPSKCDDLASQGIVVRQADYGDVDALTEAFAGVGSLYFVSGMAAEDERIQQHKNVVNASVAAGCQRILYTSFVKADPDSVFYPLRVNVVTEADVSGSGLEWVILRSGMYCEADLDYYAQYVEQGRIANNIGPGARISYISRRDLGLAGAILMQAESDSPYLNRIVTLTGPEALTQVDLAALLTSIRREKEGEDAEELPYVTLEDEEYMRTFPTEHWGQIIVALYQMVREGDAAGVSSDFRDIVGRDAFTLEETWREYYSE